MSRFALRFPYLIIVICLITCVVGVTSLVRMPVDLFPPINIPVVVVATFYAGMPPEQIENDITGQFERMFTLASGYDHMESRSLTGVSLIKVYFQPGSNPDSDVTSIANLAMASLRYLPSGTLPPVVMKFDASSLPVCLVTLKGEGLSESQLRDLGQFTVRNQMAGIPGASVPPAFGGRYRQIMVYVDPLKLEAHQLSVMDVVRTVNEANLILPSGDVKIGPYDYDIYANNQINAMQDLDLVPLKTVGEASVLVGDVGKAQDASQIQYNKVRINGQASVYVPVLKQGGDANTITVVNGVKRVVSRLLDIPKQLVTEVVFDQSVFVRTAIETLVHEGAIGLDAYWSDDPDFPRQHARHGCGVPFHSPLGPGGLHRALALGGSTINAMILGGLALALFSRLIDNSPSSCWRTSSFAIWKMGEAPEVAAERGGKEVQLPVLAATLTTVIVFFPVTMLYGVSKFLFGALALSVVLSLFASYVVAMTVVPLFCAKLIKKPGADHELGFQCKRDADARPGDGTRVSMSGSTASSTACSPTAMKERAEQVPAAAAGHGNRHHRDVHPEPRALSVDRQGLLPAHGPRPVCHQRQSAFGNPPGTDRPVGRAGRGHCSRGRAETGPENHCFQHRDHAGFQLHPQPQLLSQHRDRAGGVE